MVLNYTNYYEQINAYEVVTQCCVIVIIPLNSAYFKMNVWHWDIVSLHLSQFDFEINIFLQIQISSFHFHVFLQKKKKTDEPAPSK